MVFDPGADRIGRMFAIALAVWGGVAGLVYVVLTLAFPTSAPVVAPQPQTQSSCHPTVPFELPIAFDPAVPVISSASNCRSHLRPSVSFTTLLRAYLDGAELDGAPHQPKPIVDAALQARGSELFARHCAACHGKSGDGAGPNACALVTQPAILMNGIYALRTTEHEALPTDEDIFRTITRGIHGTAMPPWFALPERDRWALVAHVKTLSKQFSEDVAPPPVDAGNPPAATPERVENGRVLFATRGCASCHGDTGHGDGAAAATMPIKPRDFTSGLFHRGSSVADIHDTLVTGLDGTPMAAFVKVMSPDELWNVSLYVSTLAPAMVERDGLRCPVTQRPLNPQELFGVRNVMRSLAVAR